MTSVEIGEWLAILMLTSIYKKSVKSLSKFRGGSANSFFRCNHMGKK